eukprot:m.192169 g.192169  ORF g.192169 m.192169 type:complete len:649 (+) comp18260_c1_seq2:213-2159(+)
MVVESSVPRVVHAVGACIAEWPKISAAVALVTVGGAYIYSRARPRFPRGWYKTRHKVTLRAVGREFEELLHDKFDPSKVPPDMDALIIGSGLSGLFLGALLAKIGKRVVVLEQHNSAGGCLQSFVSDGLRFEVGCHTVGLVPERYGPMLDILCSAANQVHWSKIGCGETDVVEIDGVEPFSIACSKENIVKQLVDRFPEERAAIEEYAKMIIFMNMPSNFKLQFGTQSLPRWQQWLLQNVIYRRQFGKFRCLAAQTVSEVVSSLTKNKELAAIICSRFDYYGTPETTSFLAHALSLWGFSDGSYFPVGGPSVISAALCDTIVESGGRVLTQADVAHIRVSRHTGAAVGVTLANGHSIMVDDMTPIISSCGAVATSKMVPASVQFPLAAPPCGNGPGHVMAFIGLDGNPEELQLPRTTLFCIKSHSLDLDSCLRGIVYSPLVGDLFLRITFPCAKDKAWTSLYPGKSNCIILMLSPPEWFCASLKAAAGELGTVEEEAAREAHKKLTSKLQEVLVRLLIKRFPQLADRITMVQMATPLTLQKYLRRESSYGLQHSPERYVNNAALRPRTSVPNLFLTGQDVVTHLVPGAIESALLTAHTLLGYTAADMFLFNRTLIGDLVVANAAEIAVRRPRERVKAWDEAVFYEQSS